MIPEVETEIARGTKRLQKILDVKLATYFLKDLKSSSKSPDCQRPLKFIKDFPLILRFIF